MQTYESGLRVTDLANMYNMSKSTISTILQRKYLYKEASVAKRVTQFLVPKRLRPQKQVPVGYRHSQGEKGHQRAREPIVVSGRLSLGVSERIIGISIISYGRKIVLTYDQLELRPALGNELSS